MVFDDEFSTVNSLPTEDSLDIKWTRIFKLDKEFYLDLEYGRDGNLITSNCPNLSPEWLDLRKKVGKTILSRSGSTTPGGASSDDEIQAPGGARNEDGPAKNTRSQKAPDKLEAASFATVRISEQPPAAISNLGSLPSQLHGNTKLIRAYVVAQPILQDTWDSMNDLELAI